MNAYRIFLLGVIVTLAIAALLGIAAVLSLDVNWRFVITDLTLTLFSLTCLGATIPRHRSTGWRWVQFATYAVSMAGLVLSLILIWADLDYAIERPLGQAVGICIAWAIALPAGSLLAMTRFQGGIAWVRIAAIALVYSLAALISLVTLDRWNSELGGRAVALNAILASLGMVAAPILHRLYGLKNPTDPLSTKLEIEAVCPRCSHKHNIPAGDSACPLCKLKFRLEIEEPKCSKCGYLLYRLPGNRCPECGQTFSWG